MGGVYYGRAATCHATVQAQWQIMLSHGKCMVARAALSLLTLPPPDARRHALPHALLHSLAVGPLDQ